MADYFVNTAVLVKFIWRRDRLRISLWIICIVATSVAVALAFPNLYPAGPERDILAETLKNPAIIAMLGPGYGLGDYHVGAVMAHQMLLFTAIAVAIMNILLTIRHTRRDEEMGRTEVIRAQPVGKLSNGAATLLVLISTNLITGMSLSISLAVLALGGMDWRGSLLYGAVISSTGIFFAALTIMIAQLTEGSRTALALSFTFLGLSYLLRAIGDVSSEALSLLSPLGLILRTQTYVNNLWWPIWLMAAISLLLIYVGLRLNLMRDLAAGLLLAKPGSLTAAFYLRGPLSLVFRLQKITIIGWAIGMFVMGVSYGSVFADVDAFFQTSDLFELLLPGIEGFSLADQFVATLLAVVSMIGVIPALLIVLKIKTEEQLNRLEQLLSQPVSRWALLGSYILAAVLSSVLVQLSVVLGLWLATSAVMVQPYELVWLLKGGLTYLPVYWVIIGFAVVLIGFIPDFTAVVWLHLGYTFFVIYFGGLLRLPAWLSKLTPFGYVPDVPLEKMNFYQSLALLLLAVLFSIAGLAGYRRRDIRG